MYCVSRHSRRQVELELSTWISARQVEWGGDQLNVKVMTNSDCLAGFNPLHLNKAQRRFFGQKPEPESFRGLLGLFFLPAWHLAWYECEWAAGCISLSDNRRLASAAILDKIRVCWPTLAGGMGTRRRSIRHTRRTLHSEYILTARFTLFLRFESMFP